jgi:hypothetical protein
MLHVIPERAILQDELGYGPPLIFLYYSFRGFGIINIFQYMAIVSRKEATKRPYNTPQRMPK